MLFRALLSIGPLLFRLCINDLPKCLLFSKPSLYADDTSLNHANGDLQRIDDGRFQYRIHLWLADNKLTLNLKKTEFMLLASRLGLSTISEILYFMVHDHPVMQVPSTKSLCVGTY